MPIRKVDWRHCRKEHFTGESEKAWLSMNASRDLTRRPSSLASEVGMCVRLTRLVLSIILEGVFTLIQFILFPLRRTAERARIRDVIVGRSGVVSVAFLTLLAVSGCSTTQPGGSFQKQIDETVWSAKQLITADDAQKSLEDDLQDFSGDLTGEELRWELEQIFLSPDAQASLESDLRDFSDPELGQLRETFEMLGW
jgi:hypothetical protein